MRVFKSLKFENLITEYRLDNELTIEQDFRLQNCDQYYIYSVRALVLVGKAKGSKHAYIIATVVTIQDLACDRSMRRIWKPSRQQKVALTGLSQRLRASEPLYYREQGSGGGTL
jgi:hypothetical protein